jgi:multidrug efflux pump subunit AcrA (membrane-fusion protein)
VSKSPVARAGNYVRQGTPLFEIDARDYELEVRRLTKEYEQSGVNLAELDVELENTAALAKLADEELELLRRDVQRLDKLFRENRQGVVTESQLDETRRKELVARNARLTLENQALLLRTRRSRWESAQELVAAQLDKAKLDLERTKVFAPCDGVVVLDAVEADDFVQRGTPLVTLEDTSRVEVRTSLRMEHLHWLWQQTAATPIQEGEDPAARDYQVPPTPVTVVYDIAGEKFLWKGRLSRYDGIGLDEKTRLVPCRVAIDDPRACSRGAGAGESTDSGNNGDTIHHADGPPALVRGMYVTVWLHAQPQQRLLRLPERAVYPGNLVWLVVDGKLQSTRVTVAAVNDGVVLVREPSPVGQAALLAKSSRTELVPFANGNGTSSVLPSANGTSSVLLAPGAKVVVSPLSSAADGMQVREQPSP